jgi:hypothetical protein
MIIGNFISIGAGKSTIGPPDYSAMTDVVFHARSEGLVTNTTNDYGTVDGSGNVTSLKSLTPGPTGRNFASNGTAPTLTADGISFGGAGRLRGTSTGAWANFMHYNATPSAIKFTIHGVLKLGSTSNPDALYGIIGNNGISSANKGVGIYMDNRSTAVTDIKSNFGLVITKGVSNNLLNSSTFNNNTIPINTFFDFWLDIDRSLGLGEQIKLFINGERVVTHVRNDGVNPITTPTYELEIGGTGNATFTSVMTLKELTILSAPPSDEYREDFILRRMNKYGLNTVTTVDSIPMVYSYSAFNTYNDGRYYLSTMLQKNPTNNNTSLVITDSTAHLFASDKKLSMFRSTDGGLTWGAKSTIIDPVGTEAIGDGNGGYDSNGRLHVFTDSHTSYNAGASTNKAYYLYSDNDGDTWTTANITAQMPANGMVSWRMYGNLIENEGVLMHPFYMVTDEATITNSARYIWRSTDYGANWTPVLVETGTIYRNESSIIALSATHILMVTRDEVTGEFAQYMSTDNGLNWTNQGALTFNESFTVPCTARLRKVVINGTNVVACYYVDRTNDWAKVVYGTFSNLITNGLTGWNLKTKTLIYQGSSTEHLHYGDVLHEDDGFSAIGVYPRDTYPGSGGTVNTIDFFQVPTYQYSNVKSLLGL